MRWVVLALLVTACAHNDGPATMVYGNVVDHQRYPVKQFNEKRTCDISRGLLHKQSLGVTQYFDCEPAVRN